MKKKLLFTIMGSSVMMSLFCQNQLSKNFQSDHPQNYVGHTLTVVDKPEKYQSYGYEGFYIDYTKPGYNHDGGDKNNVYKCCDKYGSKYTEMVGRQFKVLSVKDSENENVYFLELEQIPSGDIVYYRYDQRYENSFVFAVNSYLDYAHKEYVGELFLTRGEKWSHSLKDRKTNQPVDVSQPIEWVCIDVKIAPQLGAVALILRDEQGRVVPFKVSDIDNKHMIYRMADIENLNKNFNEATRNNIIEGVVTVGFTEEMVKLAWGQPDEVKDFGDSGEQWFYKSEYVLIKDGKVIMIN